MLATQLIVVHSAQWTILLYCFMAIRAQTKVSIKQGNTFSQKGRAINDLSPAQAALIQHTKRVAYQAGYSCGQMMTPSPSKWRWNNKTAGGWSAFWTILPEASEACRELLRCGCKQTCTKRCKCKNAPLQCTALCLCGGKCTYEYVLEF